VISAFRFVAAVVALVAFTACDAGVATHIQVSEMTTEVTVTVTLTGAAADSLTADPAAEAEVLAVFNDLGAQAPTSQRGSGNWSASAQVSAEQVAAASGFTAVAALTRHGAADATTLTVVFTEPTRLHAAYDAAVVGRPDAADLRAALGAATMLSVTVRFPGGVTAAPATVAGIAVERTADEVQVRFGADEVPVGAVLSVTGDPEPPARWPAWLPTASLLAALLAGAYLTFGHRHQRGASR
jgi:hypothetical protein